LVSVPPRAAPTSTPNDPPSAQPSLCFFLACAHGRHHSRSSSLPPGTQSLCYPCDTAGRRVGHANGIVAPLWKLCGRARLQFAPCQLYLRIGSHDDTDAPGLDETRRDARACTSIAAAILSADPHLHDRSFLLCLRSTATSRCKRGHTFFERASIKQSRKLGLMTYVRL